MITREDGGESCRVFIHTFVRIILPHSPHLAFSGAYTRVTAGTGGLAEAQTERKTLCGHAIIWCEAPWPYSPRGPGEGGNGQLISVNCEWVRASEQPFPCSEAWLLWLLAGQEIQTLYCLVSTLSAGLPIPGPWQLTALCWTLSRAVKPQEPDRVLMSAIGTQRQAVSGSPGRRQCCSVYLGPQSGGHHPGQQLQWQPDGQHQDPDVGGHGHWPYTVVWQIVINTKVKLKT